jgi:hypothetical protein
MTGAKESEARVSVVIDTGRFLAVVVENREKTDATPTRSVRQKTK